MSGALTVHDMHAQMLAASAHITDLCMVLLKGYRANAMPTVSLPSALKHATTFCYRSSVSTIYQANLTVKKGLN